MASRLLLLAVFLQLTIVLGSLFKRGAQLEPVSLLKKRDNPYYGGFALVQGVVSCPAGTETCATGFCCPLGTYCSQDSNQPYCCPTSEDCESQVVDLPTCADPTWSMFLDAYYYCCPTDDVGIVFGQCQSKALTFSSNQYAQTTAQANTLPPTGNAPLPSSTGTGAGTFLSTTGVAATTKTTSSGGAQTSAAGKGHGNRIGGPEQMILGGVVGLAAMAVPAIL